MAFSWQWLHLICYWQKDNEFGFGREITAMFLMKT